MAVSAAANVELVRPNSHAVADNARPCSLSKHVHMNVFWCVFKSTVQRHSGRAAALHLYSLLIDP